ncbi:PhoX family protein [Exilibacterium tricleocarpae]|uniref:PhoX family protein n=1 Tax=Exilibacterium tricleocarpae TaxID=2591008 RepID=UPI0015D0F44B|nr:PhoX family phosphatase [Exilibacterium tricleocarpae]
MTTVKKGGERQTEGREAGAHFVEVFERRLKRREVLQGLVVGGSALVLAGLGGCGRRSDAAVEPVTSLTFREIPHRLDETHHVAPGYRAEVLLRWGDPLFAGAPPFAPLAQSGAAQALQFGNNNDFIGYLPLAADSGADKAEHLASANSERGLLCVNHEHTRPHHMFPKPGAAAPGSTPVQIEADMAAHGHSVVEIEKRDGRWQVVLDSPYNRRITALTETRVSGPAAGHPRLRTAADPSGRKVPGTFANCSGGITPWGTVLTAEENFRHYFGGDTRAIEATHPREAQMHRRFDILQQSRHYWQRLEPRFNIEREPLEPNRYGWVVEIDPYDPAAPPIKRTALGRFQHEAATVVAEPGAPVVVYSGDDSPDEYIFRFVSAAAFDADNLENNRDLLDAGTLYAARFDDDGSGRWLPLRHGEPGLTAADGFASQADILIDARLAADAVGATRMDRPEDVETNPVTGRVYVSLTRNTERAATDAANPRARNLAGHILELSPPGTDGARDHLADEFRWEVFVLAGDPKAAGADRGRYGAGTSEHGWFCNPDNFAFDPRGRLWIATDGFVDFGVHDGLWAADTGGPGRALCKHFFGCPRGAELCGPCFTPDGKTLFLAVQHPGDEEGADFANPTTLWPDFKPGMPPRASVMAITKEDGGEIGA